MTNRIAGAEVVRRQTEAWNSHDASRVAAGYASGATVLDPVYPEPLIGREAIKKDASDFFSAFPDAKFHPTKVIEDSGVIVLEGMAEGTHTGPLQLPTGMIPPTNRRLVFGVAIFLDVDETGDIRQERRYYDVAGQLVQLGLVQ